MVLNDTVYSAGGRDGVKVNISKEKRVWYRLRGMERLVTRIGGGTVGVVPDGADSLAGVRGVCGKGESCLKKWVAKEWDGLVGG